MASGPSGLDRAASRVPSAALPCTILRCAAPRGRRLLDPRPWACLELCAVNAGLKSRRHVVAEAFDELGVELLPLRRGACSPRLLDVTEGEVAQRERRFVARNVPLRLDPAAQRVAQRFDRVRRLDRAGEALRGARSTSVFSARSTRTPVRRVRTPSGPNQSCGVRTPVCSESSHSGENPCRSALSRVVAVPTGYGVPS